MTTVVMANGAARPTLVVPNGGLGAGRGKHRSGRSGGLFRGRQRRRTVLPAAALEQWDPEQAECMLMEGGTVVVSFGTTWCGPCAILAPELETAATALEDYDNITIAKLDAEAAPSVASMYGVGAYPTTIWMLEGREVHRLEGSLPAAALVQLTARHLLSNEEEEVLRVEQPEWFGPVELGPV